MSTSSFTIIGRYPSLNEYTSANRSNRYAGSKMKKEETDRAFWACLEHKVKRVKNYPITLKITWHEIDRRRDIDNITWSVKFLLDGMVKAKVIEDDSQKYVVGIENHIKVDRKNPRIEVEIIENRQII